MLGSRCQCAAFCTRVRRDGPLRQGLSAALRMTSAHDVLSCTSGAGKNPRHHLGATRSGPITRQRGTRCHDGRGEFWLAPKRGQPAAFGDITTCDSCSEAHTRSRVFGGRSMRARLSLHLFHVAPPPRPRSDWPRRDSIDVTSAKTGSVLSQSAATHRRQNTVVACHGLSRGHLPSSALYGASPR
jgi:hypothetical protein